MPEIKQIHQNLIPTFNGDKNTLANYVDACEYLLQKFLIDPADLVTANELLMIFKGKIEGKAREALNANKKPTTWQELKVILVHNFGDKRSEAVMAYDLNNTLPKHAESIASYASRIKTTLYSLLSKINLEEEDDNRKAVKLEEYNQLALQTFLCGIYSIDRELTQEVKIRQPDDIETAESVALEIENFNTLQRRKLGAQRFNNTPKQQPIQIPQQRQMQTYPQIPAQAPQPPQTYTPQRPTFTQARPNFIPPAINMPRPQQQQRFVTAPASQQQRFAPSPGQWNQRPTIPTPMDVDRSNVKRPASTLQRPAKRQWPANVMTDNVTSEEDQQVTYVDQDDEYYGQESDYYESEQNEDTYYTDYQTEATQESVNFMKVSIYHPPE